MKSAIAGCGSTFVFAALAAFAAACGGDKPPPQVAEAPKTEDRPRENRPAPMVQQELGSIDQRAVEQTFGQLQGKLESCHKQGRDRVEYLSGDVKVFLRVDGAGKVRYGYFEESSLGDRQTEKCILDVFSRTDWPKPQGGEAEVRNGFGWPAGGERAPTSWPSDKVTDALADAKDIKKSVDKCKSGVSGTFRLTAYVEHDDNDAAQADETAPAKAKPGKASKPTPKSAPKAEKRSGGGGKFKAIGIAAPTKEAAEKVDCIVDALTPLDLPSPGSYAAKVSFTL